MARKQIRKEGNAVTRVVSVESVMRRADFVAGFKQARSGKPFDYDTPRKHAWSYERGRQFGFLYSGELKTGAKILLPAKLAYVNAVNAREIL